MSKYASIPCALLACAGLVAAGSAGAANAGPPASGPTVGDLYRAFETVAFGAEFGDRKPRTEVLKWEKPLTIAVRAFDDVLTDHGNGITEIAFTQTPVLDRHLEITNKHLYSLSQLTDLEMVPYQGTGEVANLTINFVTKAHLAHPSLVNHEDIDVRRLAAQNGCYFVIWKNNQARAIDRAVIVVNTERDARALSHCVLEELTQSLGLPNDNNVPWPSIFADNQKVTELSSGDRILVRTLYDPEIRSGMDKREVMRKAFKIISRLHQETFPPASVPE